VPIAPSPAHDHAAYRNAAGIHGTTRTALPKSLCSNFCFFGGHDFSRAITGSISAAYLPQAGFRR